MRLAIQDQYELKKKITAVTIHEHVITMHILLL